MQILTDTERAEQMELAKQILIDDGKLPQLGMEVIHTSDVGNPTKWSCEWRYTESTCNSFVEGAIRDLAKGIDPDLLQRRIMVPSDEILTWLDNEVACKNANVPLGTSYIHNEEATRKELDRMNFHMGNLFDLMWNEV